MIDSYGRPISEFEIAARERASRLQQWGRDNERARQQLEAEREDEQKRQRAVARAERAAERADLEEGIRRRLRAAGAVSEREITAMLPGLVEKEIIRRAEEPEDHPEQYRSLI